MFFKSIQTGKDEGTESIETFYFTEGFLKRWVKCLSQISNDTNEFSSATHTSKIVYCMSLS